MEKVTEISLSDNVFNYHELLTTKFDKNLLNVSIGVSGVIFTFSLLNLFNLSYFHAMWAVVVFQAYFTHYFKEHSNTQESVKKYTIPSTNSINKYNRVAGWLLFFIIYIFIESPINIALNSIFLEDLFLPEEFDLALFRIGGIVVSILFIIAAILLLRKNIKSFVLAKQLIAVSISLLSILYVVRFIVDRYYGTFQTDFGISLILPTIVYMYLCTARRVILTYIEFSPTILKTNADAELNNNLKNTQTMSSEKNDNTNIGIYISPIIQKKESNLKTVKLNRVNFISRFLSISTGARRLLLTLSIISSFFISVRFINDFWANFPDKLLIVIFYTILLFISFWIAIRVLLWIYDGFTHEKNRNNKEY